MDPQIEKFLGEYVEKALSGPGFIIYAPKEKEEMRSRLMDFSSDLIFDTLIQNLNEEQLKELENISDFGSDESQQKIALMSASIPGFISILEDRFRKASEEIGRMGKIPDTEAPYPATS